MWEDSEGRSGRDLLHTEYQMALLSTHEAARGINSLRGNVVYLCTATVDIFSHVCYVCNLRMSVNSILYANNLLWSGRHLQG